MITKVKKLTVGVVCFEEEAAIAPLLDSLSVSSNSAYISELLMVDNSLNKTTENWIKNSYILKSGLKISFIESFNNNLGEARRNIVAACRSDLLAFVDADCSVPVNWLKKLTGAYEETLIEDNKLAGVCGPNRLPNNLPIQKALNALVSSPLGHGYSPQAYSPREMTKVKHLPTTNCLFDVSKIKSVGSFSANFETCGEDLELGLKLNSAGLSMYLMPEPQVINNSAENLKQWAKRMFKFGRVQYKAGRKTLFYASCLFLCLLGILVFARPVLVVYFLSAYILYLCLESLRLGFKNSCVRLSPLLLILFLVTHFFYGLGIVWFF